MTGYRDAYRTASREAATLADRCADLGRQLAAARVAVARLGAERDEARERERMAWQQRDLLRQGHLTTRVEEIRAAIAEPWSITPWRGGTETISAWCARAVVAVLGGHDPALVTAAALTPDDPALPDDASD